MSCAAIAVRRFAVAGRDLYPSFLSALADETGTRRPLRPQRHPRARWRTASPPHRPSGSEWIDARALRALEPGARRLRRRRAPPARRLRRQPRAPRRDAPPRRAAPHRSSSSRASVRSVNVTAARPRVILEDGDVRRGRLARGRRPAPGPRSSTGFPARSPCARCAGSCCMLEGALSRHVIYGGGGYLVPRRYPDAPAALRAHDHRRDDGGGRLRQRHDPRGARGRSPPSRAASPPPPPEPRSSCRTGPASAP